MFHTSTGFSLKNEKMNCVSNILENVDSIVSWSNIGLLIFISFFVLILIKTFKMPKKEVEEIKNSIFDK